MKLIANGDDFGITRACNYAIIDCYKEGILRSTSMMPNMPHVEHAAKLMKENPGLSVGIHFNLTVGKPLTNCPSLVNENGLFDKKYLKDSSNVKVEEVRAELEAQYNRFVEVTGQKPHHLNSHHGICMIKGAEEIQVEIANREGLPIRQMFTMMMGKSTSNPKHGVTKMFPMPMSNEFSKPETLISACTKEMLESDECYEVCAHPGYVDYEILQTSSLTEGRAHDANLFMCDEIKTWVKDNNIELVDYREITK